MRNKQIHNDTGIPLLQDWIKIQFKNFHANLNASDGARFYNIGNKTKKSAFKTTSTSRSSSITIKRRPNLNYHYQLKKNID